MFIVIEKHGGWEYAGIVIDEEGNNKIFDTIEEAVEEAKDCQDGIVVGDETIDRDYLPFNEELHTIFSMLEEAERDFGSENTEIALALAKERLNKLINQLKEG